MVSQISLYNSNLAKSVVGLFNSSLLIPVACGKVLRDSKPRIFMRGFSFLSRSTRHIYLARTGNFFRAQILSLHKMKTETMSKGEFIRRVFDRMDALNLHEKMNDLFRKHKMEFADLTELREKSKADFDLWYKMHHRSNRLMAFTTFTILGR